MSKNTAWLWALVALPLSLGLLMQSGCATRTADSGSFALTLLHSNDTHSYLAGRDKYGNACFASADCEGGVARMATVLQQERKTGGNVLAVDAGDRFQGTLFYTVNKSPMLAEVDKLLPYDAMTLGNHEFDDGCTVAADFVRGHAFPVLAANLVPEPGCPLHGEQGTAFKPYIIRNFKGVRVGVVGLANPDVLTLGAACAQTRFLDSKTALQKAVTELEAHGVHHIVVVTHLGLPVDRELARSVNGVDIIVGGHTHSYLGKAAGESAEGDYPVVERSPSGQPVLVVTAKFAAQYLGKLNIVFDAAGVAQSWNGEALLLDKSITPDPKMEKLVQGYAVHLEKFRSVKVGSHNLDFADGMEACRTADCLAGLVTTDAMLEYARPYGAVAALRNSGSLRAPLKRGELNQGDVLAVLPFANTVVIRQFTGAQLLAALEHGIPDKERTSAHLLQVAGLRYSFDMARPVGKRLTSAEMVDGKGKAVKIDTIKTYTVALLNYLARGGDSFAMLTKGTVVPAPDLLDVDIVSGYIKRHCPLPMPQRYGVGRIMRK